METSEMATSFAIKPVDRDTDLLLETAETIMNMAKIARSNESDEETKAFYSHVLAYCLVLLQDRSFGSRTSFRLNGEESKRALCLLGSLAVETGLQNKQSEATLESRLRALNHDWNETRNQHSDELQFIKRCMKQSEDHQRKVDKVLGRCLDDLLKRKLPEKCVKESELKRKVPEAGELPHSVWKVAKLAFDALVKCKECSCHENREFRAKIELGTYRKCRVFRQPQTNRPSGYDTSSERHDFQIFLSMEQIRHHVQVQTSERIVRFDTAEDVPSYRPGSSRKSLEIDTLCKPIAKKTTKQCLKLELTKENLFFMGYMNSNFQLKKTTEPISLAQCLANQPNIFTEKAKRILSLILGYTVFHLNDTQWLQSGWGSADVQFFGRGSCKTSLRPFIRAQLPEPGLGRAVPESQTEEDLYDEPDEKHCCPALVALAVVLMELQFSRPFKALADMHGVSLDETLDGRIKLLDAYQVFYGSGEDISENGLRSEIPDNYPLISAIDNCLNSSHWEDSEGAALDKATLRGRVYQYVVQPLEEQLTMGFNIPLDDVDRRAATLDLENWCQDIPSHESNGHTTFLSAEPHPNPAPSPPPNMRYTNMYQHPVPNTVLSYREFQFFDDEVVNGGVPDVYNEKYRTWISEYQKVYKKCITDYLSGSLIQPVKVAILDTGIDRDNAYSDTYKESIKGTFNCYSESQKTNVQDRNGHGTFTASLVLAYAPDAEIYIVKIADKENVRPDAKIVADAISHAVDDWGVDIISMSFGWPSSDFEGHDVLDAAIDKAYGEKVLMFAAASNSGGKRGRAYPASSTHVICVHSTDTDGNRSRFSPTNEPNTINFATLGESVESVWPVPLCEGASNTGIVQSRSGTSYATSILAGIAAFLLQYARLCLGKGVAERLKRKDKMEALLKRCAERGPNYAPRDGYYFVELSLNSHNLFGEGPEEVKHEILKALKR